MLPRKIHIDQINRFHDEFEKLSKEIEEAKAAGMSKDHVGELCLKYVSLTQVWPSIDDFIEYDLQVKLDEILITE